MRRAKFQFIFSPNQRYNPRRESAFLRQLSQISSRQLLLAVELCTTANRNMESSVRCHSTPSMSCTCQLCSVVFHLRLVFLGWAHAGPVFRSAPFGITRTVPIGHVSAFSAVFVTFASFFPFEIVSVTPCLFLCSTVFSRLFAGGEIQRR